MQEDCYPGYQIVKLLSEDTNILYEVEPVSDSSHTTYIMKVYRGKDALKRYSNEICYLTFLSSYDIAPRVIYHKRCNDDAAVAIIEKFSYSVKDLVEDEDVFADIKEDLIAQIDQKIGLMHQLDIGHGDLHPGNIVVNLNPLRAAIIDFEYAYKISAGEHDPRVKEWMKRGFDWTGTYSEFVEYDLQNWKYAI